MPYGRRLHGPHQEGAIHFTRLQRTQSVAKHERLELRIEAVQVVGFEQRLRKCANAAPGRADGDALVAQLVQLRQRLLPPIEEPDRLVVQRREHDEAAAVSRPDHSAVHERDVDTGLRVVQQELVLVRAAGQSLLDRDALAREYRLVALRELVIHAVLEPGREDDVARDRALQEPRAHHRDRDQRERKQCPAHEAAPAAQAPISDAHAGNGAAVCYGAPRSR